MKLPTICQSIIDTISSNSFKANTQVLECLISVILNVESEFEPYAEKFLPLLIEFTQSKDWNARKMAIDCIYTLAALLKDVIVPFKKEILKVLAGCKYDKMKPVWEATLEAICQLKEIGPPEDSDNSSQASSIRKTDWVKKKRWKDPFGEAKVINYESDVGSVTSVNQSETTIEVSRPGQETQQP